MEQDIAAQVVGLGGTSDFFSLEPFYESRLCGKVCHCTVNRELNIFMGFNL